MLPAAALERGAHACEGLLTRLGLTLNGVGTVELYVGEGGDAEGKNLEIRGYLPCERRQRDACVGTYIAAPCESRATPWRRTHTLACFPSSLCSP